MTPRTLSSLLLLSLLTAVTPLLAQTSPTPLGELREVWKEWSRIRSLISEEKAQWEREEQSIADALNVSRQETELLKGKLTTLNEGSTGNEKARADLLDKISESKTNMTVFTEAIGRLEGTVRELTPVLPTHLKAELAPVLQRIPAEGKPTQLPVSQRMQTVVAFLAQLDRFNSTPSLVSEIREVEPGKSLEVQTLYFGLGIAYYSDPAGTFAGWGQPTLEGWKWTKAEADGGKKIAEAIAIHQNQKQPAFVALPIKVEAP